MRHSRTFREFTDTEVTAGLAHAKRKYELDLDSDLLRKLANESGRERKPGKILPMVITEVARSRNFLRERDLKESKRFEAYLGAVAKMFSDRSVHKRRAEAERRKLGEPAPPKEPDPGGKFPVDKKGQYRMI